MSSVLSLLSAGGWQRLIIDALWQSTLIAALGSLAAGFLVRQAAARACLLLLTLTACLMVPVASMAARSAGWTVLSRASSSVDATPVHLDVDLLPARVAPPTNEMTATAPRAIAAQDGIAAARVAINGLYVTGMVWLSASTFLFARLALSLLAVWRLLRQARPCPRLRYWRRRPMRLDVWDSLGHRDCWSAGSYNTHGSGAGSTDPFAAGRAILCRG